MQENSNINDSLDSIEALIRSGRSETALQFAQGFASKRPQLSEAQLVRLANLLRRSGGFEDAIRLLHKHIRGDTLKTPQMPHAEYGCALVQLGLLEEADKILKSINSAKFPMVLLYRALGNFSEWNYKSAVPLLEKFVQAEDVDPYQKMVGKVNLLVALAFAKPHPDLLVQLEDLLKETRSKNLGLLEGVVNQVRGRLLTTLNQFSQATSVYNAGLEKMKLVETFDRFYLEKWQLINEARFKGLTKYVEEKFERLHLRAIKARDYETARDCYFYKNMFYGNAANINFCFYGTPYAAYRERFKDLPIKNSLWLEIGTSGPSSAKLRLNSIEKKLVSDVEESLYPGRLLHRLYLVLISDFYRPITVPRIFSSAFKGQYWNPQTSAIQVRQAILRLRRHLKNLRCGINVVQKNGGYYLAATKENRLILIREQTTKPSFEAKALEKLKSQVKKGDFTFYEFSEATGCSLRTNRRIIRKLLDSGKIVAEGKTRKTIFVLSKFQTEHHLGIEFQRRLQYLAQLLSRLREY